jgi:hypothetical protein
MFRGSSWITTLTACFFSKKRPAGARKASRRQPFRPLQVERLEEAPATLSIDVAGTCRVYGA